MLVFKINSVKIVLVSILITFSGYKLFAQDFQGKAYYFSKTPMQLGSWGATMSAEQKKQIAARLKNRLEKTYVLTFNMEESIYKEDEKLDAISGATDSWGKNFTPGEQYKNIKTKTFLQDQEFYGKQFLIKDKVKSLDWVVGTESKQIGKYTCFKAMALLPAEQVEWWAFSWGNLSDSNNKEEDSLQTDAKEDVVKMTQIEAWYAPQIPVSQGPGEYWGLPGLILEVSFNSTTLLCSKIVMNPKEKIKIVAPSRGKSVTKKEYSEIIINKMKDFRDNRMRRRR